MPVLGPIELIPLLLVIGIVAWAVYVRRLQTSIGSMTDMDKVGSAITRHRIHHNIDETETTSDRRLARQCPECDEIDEVYKVSALYDYGFSTQVVPKVVHPPPDSKLPPLHTTEEKTIQSALSKRLSPPQNPFEKYYNPIGFWGTVLIAAFTFIIGALFIVPLVNYTRRLEATKKQAQKCRIGIRP